MKENLRPGVEFPHIELPSHEDEVVKLSSIIHGFPTAVVFSRGYRHRRGCRRNSSDPRRRGSMLYVCVVSSFYGVLGREPCGTCWQKRDHD